MSFRPLALAFAAFALAACGGKAVEPVASAAPSAAPAPASVLAVSSPPPAVPGGRAPAPAPVAPVASASAATPEDPPDLAGGDRDAHGCMASAGYLYSALRKECIRIFEKGIALDPVPLPKGSEAVISASIVFAGDDHTVAKNESVEIMVPKEGTSVVLMRAKKSSEYTKEGSPFTVTYGKMWEIKKGGKTIYLEAK